MTTQLSGSLPTGSEIRLDNGFAKVDLPHPLFVDRDEITCRLAGTYSPAVLQAKTGGR